MLSEVEVAAGLPRCAPLGCYANSSSSESIEVARRKRSPSPSASQAEMRSRKASSRWNPRAFEHTGQGLGFAGPTPRRIGLGSAFLAWRSSPVGSADRG